jgi:hypothetical protein
MNKKRTCLKRLQLEYEMFYSKWLEFRINFRISFNLSNGSDEKCLNRGRPESVKSFFDFFGRITLLIAPFSWFMSIHSCEFAKKENSIILPPDHALLSQNPSATKQNLFD